jgi:hypothetical protein
VAKQLEPGIAEQVKHVLPRPGEEVVDAKDVMAVGEQPLAQMRTQESGAAGDQYSLCLEIISGHAPPLIDWNWKIYGKMTPCLSVTGPPEIPASDAGRAT